MTPTQIKIPIHSELVLDRSMYDDANEERSKFSAPEGLTEETVREIFSQKKEPEWMLAKRLQGLKLFMETALPDWGPNLSGLDLNKIIYFVRPDAPQSRSWEDVPADIKRTFERIGIPEAERKSLSGVGAQYDSDVVYHKLKKEWEDQGVVFLNMDDAVREHPELVKKYFMTQCVPVNDHKFIMLHAAVWSGGTFIYVPPGVKVTMPLQAYFRMNAKRGGQFEHTLIIADKNSEIHYIEGCFTRANIVSCNPDYKKIEDIREGDHVLTSEGVYKPTKNIQVRPYTGDIYTIGLFGDSTQMIDVTADHPFLYVDKTSKRDRNKKFNPRWNIPHFFKKGDYLAIPISQTVRTSMHHEFEIMKGAGRHGYSPLKVRVPLISEFFRLVGYYLAEGSVSANSYLNFSFGEHETALIQDVKYCLQKVFKIDKVLEMRHKKNHGVSLVVCSVTIARIFKQFGDRCDRKALPPWMLSETPKHQREIITGWFRGDGNYYRKKSKSSGWLKEAFRINTTSEKLVRQMRDVLLRLGIVAFLNKQDRSKEGRRCMYTLGITGDYLPKFGTLVGIRTFLKLNGKRRASMFGITDNFAFLPIKKISKRHVKNEPVFNFSVDDHETYTVGGVAVHNCSAPVYNESSLHAGCVELFVHEGAKISYSSVENWSKNTYNLNTKRALVDKDGTVEFINGNMGSGVTMLYPCAVLRGEGAKSDFLGVAFAGPGQNQDTGSKVIHAAPRTSSTIRSKSISRGGGISSYRGFVKVTPRATHSKVSVDCDALLVDDQSVSNTYPSMKIENKNVDIAHEARVGKISEEDIFYLMSRGISEQRALQMVVAGFIEPVVRKLPLEYAVELNKLIELEMENSVG